MLRGNGKFDNYCTSKNWLPASLTFIATHCCFFWTGVLKWWRSSGRVTWLQKGGEGFPTKVAHARPKARSARSVFESSPLLIGQLRRC